MVARGPGGERPPEAQQREKRQEAHAPHRIPPGSARGGTTPNLEGSIDFDFPARFDVPPSH
jgi:hypothetical protein